MKFGIGIPTCREGLNHPAPFAGPEEIVKAAQLAEKLGYYAVWGNDHMVPPEGSLTKYPKPPNFYEALISLSYISRFTKTIKLGVGIIVIPQREPVLLAKQAATLDHFSGGRFLLGVGLGSLRYEFEALHPNMKKANRGKMLDEGLEALQLALTKEVVSYKGQYFEFQNVAITPRPYQTPFPIYISGGNPEVPKRVAKWCSGWLVSSTTGETIKQRWEALLPALEEEKRNPAEIDMGAITTLCIGRTHQEAVDKFNKAAIPRKGDYMSTYLVGSPSELIDRIGAMGRAGLSQCITQNVAVNTYPELLEQMQLFGEEVIPALK